VKLVLAKEGAKIGQKQKTTEKKKERYQ